MSEPMTVWPEVWPVAADPTGLYLLGRDAWRASVPVASDSDIHAEVELLLHQGGVSLSDVAVIHSTSWRPDRWGMVVTYVAVVRSPGIVLASWPDAAPIGPELTQAVGPALPHASTEPPLPSYVHVMLHALRHLRFLMDYDATTRRDLPQVFQDHLKVLTPALAAMHQREHKPRAA